MSHKFSFDSLVFDAPTLHPIEMRDRLGLTNIQLAIALDVSIDTVKSWSARRRNPRRDTMVLAYQRYSQLSSQFKK